MSRKAVTLAILLSLPLASSAQLGVAQPDYSNDANTRPQLEEIVVTAERREANLQETSISIVAVNAQNLASASVFSVQDLAFVLPQLQIQPHPNSSNTLSLYLRGVGNSDEQILQDPSVGVYIDGVYLPRNMGLNLDLLDVERIEMLRGPQGTLYGRNATGGAINIITPTPESGLWGRVLYGTGDHRHRRTVARLNLPVTSSLALRLSQGRVTQQGFVENPGAAVSHFGDLDKHSHRVDLLWSASPDVTARYTYDSHSANDTPAHIAAVPLFPGKVERPRQAVAGSELKNNRVESDGHTLTINWRMTDLWAIKSISAKRSIDDSQFQNFHQGVINSNPLLVTSAFGEQSMRSQELQLIGQPTSTLDVLGGLYLFEEVAWRNAANLTPATNRRALVFGRDIKNQSSAVFARLSWKPVSYENRLILTGGLRLSDDKRRANLQRGVEDVLRGVIIMNPQLYSGQRQFRNISPELVAEFALTDSRFLYAKTSRGYKSGGFNARASSAERFTQGFDDEQLVSTELGFKSEWLQRRLRVNTALFYGDYRDIQLNVQSDPENIVLSDVLNAGGAAISGVELDLSWLLKPWFLLELNCSLLNSKLYDVRNVNNINVADDYRIIGAPNRSCRGSLDVYRSTRTGTSLFASLSYRYQTEVFGSATIAAGEYRIPEYGVLNLQAGVHLDLGDTAVTVSSWLRNAVDEKYYLSHFNGGAGRIVPSAIFGAERTAGIDLTLSFR